ncbi:MAG TPA: DUF6448 family protein [Gemmatimonadaceae bacterium]
MTRTLKRFLGLVALPAAMLATSPTKALAHCDTMDGPVVTAAQAALATGNPSHVLIWVRAQDEPDIRRAFARTMQVRALGGEARELADLYFLETVVRIHRLGEGESYTGLKPSGTDLGPAVPAADRALESGSSHELERVLGDAMREGVRERLARARAVRSFGVDEVEAGRAFVAAYVAYLHYVEGVHAAAAAAGRPHPATPSTPSTPSGHDEH